MPLNIDRQLRVFVRCHAWFLDQMHMHDTLLAVALNEESELQMVCAPLVRLLCAADEAILGIAAERVLAVRCNLGPFAKQFLAPWVLPYLLCGFVEVGGFRIGAEDVAEEEICYASLCMSVWVLRQCRVARTVAMTPTATMIKLNDCWVVRTTFSPGDSSFQRTRPVSPVNVIDFRVGSGKGVPGKVGSLAGALRVMEKAARARLVDEGCILGSSNEGRSSEIASVGL
jgi:hypothetical protein